MIWGDVIEVVAGLLGILGTLWGALKFVTRPLRDAAAYAKAALEQVGRVEGKVDLMMENHLPHIQQAMDNLTDRMDRHIESHEELG